MYGESFTLISEANVYDIRQLYYLSLLIISKKRLIPIESLTYIYSTGRKKGGVGKPKCGKSIEQHSSDYLAPRLFEKIPENIRNMNTLQNYKKHVKCWIFK